MADKNSNQLTSDQISKIRSMFDVIDDDHDGIISMGDLKSTMMSLGETPDDNDISKMIGGEEIKFPQFLNMIGGFVNETSGEEELKEAFGVFKSDKTSNNLLCDASSLKKELLNSSRRNDDLENSITEKEITSVLGDFAKKNDMTGKKYFNADAFINQIKD
ncbi:unnamed protein product [[Candida] boidinii]|nr:unnamed protein product [[Candida] boidinii]